MKNVNILTVSWSCIWKGTCIIWIIIQKGICRSRSSANSSALCAAVWLQLCFLYPVAVRVWLKPLSSSGLSSAEMAPSAISIEKATPQSGAPNSSQCSKGQPTMGRRDRICVRCAWSCAIHVQTDIYIYIYKYRRISNRPRSLALLRSRHSAIMYITYLLLTLVRQMYSAHTHNAICMHEETLHTIVTSSQCYFLQGPAHSHSLQGVSSERGSAFPHCQLL